ncbi:MAG: cytochrome c-type biogenesis protein CcmH [bacterium]|nr:cytochrome c-type biogenesis protein CcmH [bacterium]
MRPKVIQTAAHLRKVDASDSSRRSRAVGGALGSAVVRRRLGWGLVLVAFAVLVTYGSLDDRSTPSDAERAAAIARSLRCPQCAGESVAESNVSVAREIRADIARRVDAGQSDDQIRAAYAALYGEPVLLTPPARGFGSLVWIIPAVVGLTAAAGLGFAFRRWR